VVPLAIPANKITHSDVMSIYMTLTRAEAAFRAIKTPRAERPILRQMDKIVCN